MAETKEEPKEFLMVSAEVAGHKVEVAKKNLEYDAVDNCLFEPDYTVAGSTAPNGIFIRYNKGLGLKDSSYNSITGGMIGGFCIWESTFIFIDLLKGDLGNKLRGKKVVELGAGTGLAGLCAAAAGAHVLLTDLPSVKTGLMDSNIERNQKSELQSQSESGWKEAVSVGDGTAASLALDWVAPLEPQMLSSPNDPRTSDYIVALDVVWLEELLEPIRDVVVYMLKGVPVHGATDTGASPHRPIACYLAFVDRSKLDGTSTTFVERDKIRILFESSGCSVEKYYSSVAKLHGQAKKAVVLEITLNTM